MNDLRVVRLGVADRARLSALCAACTDFFELIEGQPGGDATAAELLGPLDPPYADKARHVWGLEVCASTLDWIRLHGGKVVRLVVQQQNPDARTFWERQGFSVEREVVKQFGRLESAASILKRATP